MDEIRDALTDAQESARHIQQYGAALRKLEPMVAVLQSDPEQHEALIRDYENAKQVQQQARQQAFAPEEVAQRRQHFNYGGSAGMLTENADLNDKLRQRLEHAESDRARTREMLRQQQTKCAEFNQVLASLRSSYETKSDMLRELEREMSEIGVQADANAEERARVRRDELYNQVSHNRARINQLEKQLGIGESEMDNLQKRLRKAERDYQQLREQVDRQSGVVCGDADGERKWC